jgi:SAM-dependent methyltransferase
MGYLPNYQYEGRNMHWTEKARIQRFCAALPAFSDETYYLMQRIGGSLRAARDPRPLLQASASLLLDLKKWGVGALGQRLMEIGTGRYLELPIGMYLAGAGSVLTVDVHRLLKERLVLDSVKQMLANRREVIGYFEKVANPREVAARLDALSNVHSLSELLDKASIEYRAPADATNMALPSGSIDWQFSYTVFEHVPAEVLLGMLREANRLLRPGGVTIHHIDPSDHFAHEDPSISFVNFLQYSDSEWDKLAGNSFAYHNRLRASDYGEIYRRAGHEVLMWDGSIQPQSLGALESGLPVASKFQGRSMTDLATVVLRVISRPLQAVERDKAAKPRDRQVVSAPRVPAYR